jgi:hypothetical protein
MRAGLLIVSPHCEKEGTHHSHFDNVSQGGTKRTGI